MRMELACSAIGPWHLNPDRVECTRTKDHPSMHHCWNDDGSIRIQWSDDWALGTGRWRTGDET